MALMWVLWTAEMSVEKKDSMVESLAVQLAHSKAATKAEMLGGKKAVKMVSQWALMTAETMAGQWVVVMVD
jgi:hypothetical protein